MSKACSWCGARCVLTSVTEWESVSSCLLCSREVVSTPGPRQAIFAADMDQARDENRGKPIRGRPRISEHKPVCSPEERAEILRLSALGMTQTEIARKLGTYPARVTLVILGKTWADYKREKADKKRVAIAATLPELVSVG